MRFLADMGVSLTTVEALRAENHDAIHLRDEGLVRLPDPQITEKAVAESRIVLTFDLDFGEILAVARSKAPSVIIFACETKRRLPSIRDFLSNRRVRYGARERCHRHHRGRRIPGPATTYAALNLRRISLLSLEDTKFGRSAY